MRIWMTRVFAIASLSVVFLFLPSSSGLSAPPAADTLPPAPISEEELAALNDISGWLEAASEQSLRVFLPDDLRAAIRERDPSFEVFRRFSSKEAYREFLETLPYGEQIFEIAERHQLDGLLVAALVEAESSFLPHAVSPKGAVGLMQVMPTTAEGLAREDLQDPTVNLDIGADYFRHLLESFDGDLELALAAYNAGPTRVRHYGGIPPYRETRRYVDKVLGIYVDHHSKLWQSSGAEDLRVLR